MSYHPILIYHSLLKGYFFLKKNESSKFTRNISVSPNLYPPHGTIGFEFNHVLRIVKTIRTWRNTASPPIQYIIRIPHTHMPQIKIYSVFNTTVTLDYRNSGLPYPSSTVPHSSSCRSPSFSPQSPSSGPRPSRQDAPPAPRTACYDPPPENN